MPKRSKTNSKENSSEAANHKAGDLLEFKLKGVKWRFRWCPAGSFMIIERVGVQKATLTKGFFMGETQVTQRQWKKLMGYNLRAYPKIICSRKVSRR